MTEETQETTTDEQEGLLDATATTDDVTTQEQPQDEPQEATVEVFNTIKDDIVIPEGFELSEDTSKELETILSGVPKEKAQQLIDLHIKQRQSYDDGIVKGLEERLADGEASLRADTEFGKDFDNNIKFANKALALSPNSDKLVERLKNSGMVNDPDLIKLLSVVGKNMSNDKTITGSLPNDGRPRDANGNPVLKGM